MGNTVVIHEDVQAVYEGAHGVVGGEGMRLSANGQHAPADLQP